VLPAACIAHSPPSSQTPAAFIAQLSEAAAAVAAAAAFSAQHSDWPSVHSEEAAVTSEEQSLPEQSSETSREAWDAMASLPWFGTWQAPKARRRTGRRNRIMFLRPRMVRIIPRQLPELLPYYSKT
jgi:hypothetical protein